MKLRIHIFFIFIFLLLQQSVFSQAPSPIYNIRVEAPEYIIGDQFAEIKITALNRAGMIDSNIADKQMLIINDDTTFINFRFGVGFYTLPIEKSTRITIAIPKIGIEKNKLIRYLPPWLSILPPLFAIILTLIFKDVILSLFLSIFLGVLILKGFDISTIIPALLTVVDKYIMESLRDERHLSIIIFSFLIGGIVSIISKNGSMNGFIRKISSYAHNPRSAELLTYSLGVGIFYDNYANILIAGNTMRSVTDKYKISREKLAFIVHCTASSVTAIAFITTWIGAEVGYINDLVLTFKVEESAYAIFLKSLQYTYFPVLMLAFIFFLIWFKKDFGRMYHAEINSRNAGVINESEEDTTKLKEEIIQTITPEEKRTRHWIFAFIPVFTIIITALIGLLISGARNTYFEMITSGIRLDSYSFAGVWEVLYLMDEDQHASFLKKIMLLIGKSDSYLVLLWSSFAGMFMAIILSVTQKSISFKNVMEMVIHGFRIMLTAVIILIFAWALGQVIEDLHTVEYLTSKFSGNINPVLIPAITFILAAVFSFSTGSLWGAMGILYPLLLPLTYTLALSAGLETKEVMTILYNQIAMVITGCIFGTLCSPIADTTLLSSVSADCNHIAHVRTQLPYALTVATVSFFITLLSLTGLPWLLNYLIGIVIIFLIVHYRGKRVES
ncbi:MAG TPA: Na+/H+ antiporter NhaC family protein [Cytophagaceae bacterium]